MTDKPTSFTPQTCLELIDKLNETQLNRELLNIGADVTGPTTRQQKTLQQQQQPQQLRDYYKQVLFNHCDTQRDDLQQLISTFTRHAKAADAQMIELRQTMEKADRLLSEDRVHSSPWTLPRPPNPDSIGNDDPAGMESVSVVEPPYSGLLTQPMANLDVTKLDSDTEYNRTFTNRTVGYYGEVSYKYTGGFHPARPLTDNPTLVDKAATVKGLYPDLTFNSVMVTKYRDNSDFMPPHSDNEPSIAPGSSIVTVSLGQTRELQFRRKLTTDKQVLEVKHGDVFAMTRSSQDVYDHGVPEVTDPTIDNNVRISVTFRQLNPVRTDRTKRAQTNTQTNRAKRVLILSDSKNASFDCRLLKDPLVVCFREDCFFLRDLDRHCDLIGKADVVLISAGINDMVKNAAGPRLLHDHISDFTRKIHAKYPSVRFLFDAVAPLPLTADRYNIMNPAIGELNRMMFELSLRAPNIKMFDNLGFGLSHLARDGVHLNESGKRAVSKNWVHVILIASFLRAGFLPLRQDFKDAAARYYSEVG